jgi:hypothetical protein
MTEVAGLWLSKSGKSWTGKVDFDKVKAGSFKGVRRFVLLPNKKKKDGDNKPDFQLWLGDERRTGEGQFKTDQAIDRAREPARSGPPVPSDDDLF